MISLVDVSYLPSIFVALLSIVRLHFIIYFTWLCSWCCFVFVGF